MNKTIAINISGFVFNIEEKAYEILRNYLDTIKGYFKNAEERDEIMQDIEARIAEIFHEKNSDGKEVILEEDVHDVVKVMGDPEDYRTDEGDYHEEADYEYEEVLEKRMFRDPDNATIGGVCAGLAAYLNLDPVIVRIIFVILFFTGAGFIIYIVLLIVIPEAKTTAQKLQMRGEQVNINNLKKHFRSFGDEIKENVKGRKIHKKVNTAVDKSKRVTSNVMDIILKIVGLGMITGAISVSIILISVLVGETGFFPFWTDGENPTVSEFLDVICVSEFQSSISYAAIILLMIAPIVFVTVLGLKLVFPIKQKIKVFSITMSVLIFAAFIVLSISGTQIGMNMRHFEEVEENIAMDTLQSDTLYLYANEDIHFSDHISYLDTDEIELIKFTDNSIIYGSPMVDVRENTRDTIFEIEIIKSSHGRSQTVAAKNAKSIKYDYEIEGDEIYFDPYFEFSKDDGIRGQEIQIIIYVPQGKTVYFGKNLDRVIYDVRNEQDIRDDDMTDTYWHMDRKGLTYRKS